MSATKIAASFRDSLTALVPKQPDHRLALAWLRFHAALGRTWKQGVQAPRVDRPVYPRRVEHNTLAEAGIENGARLARQDPLSDLSPTAASRRLTLL